MRFASIHRFGFTLLELLVVIAIMAVMMAITIPAFQGIGQGSRLRTSIFQVSSTLNLARQTAITTRQDVSMVFPHKTLNYQTNAVDMAYTSYGVYAFKDNAYVGEWRRLPAGVVFYYRDRPGQDPFISTNVNIVTANNPTFEKNIPFPTSSSSAQRLRGFVFRPDGAFGGAAPKGIYVTEGWIDLEAKVPVIKDEVFAMGLKLNALTGQTTVERLPEDE